MGFLVNHFCWCIQRLRVAKVQPFCSQPERNENKQIAQENCTTIHPAMARNCLGDSKISKKKWSAYKTVYETTEFITFIGCFIIVIYWYGYAPINLSNHGHRKWANYLSIFNPNKSEQKPLISDSVKVDQRSWFPSSANNAALFRRA